MRPRIERTNMPMLPLVLPPTDGNADNIGLNLSTRDEGWGIERGLDTELMVAAATGRLDRIHALLFSPRPPANWMARLRRRFERASAERVRETRIFQENRARSIRVDMRNRDGLTALMLAARNDQVDCVRALLPYAGGYAKDSAGWTALMHAAAMGHESVVKALLGASNSNESTRRGETALLLAASRGHHACVGLLAPVSDANIRDNEGRTPLFRAVEANDVELVRLLLPFSDPQIFCHCERAHDCNHLGPRTALMEATRKGYVDCVRLLLPCSSVRACAEEGLTALMFAAARGDPALVEALLPLSDPLARDRTHRGWTALLHAIASERLECIRALAADNRAGEEAAAAYRRDAVSYVFSRSLLARQHSTTRASRLIEFAEAIVDVAPWPEVVAMVKELGPETLPRSSARVEAAELAATVGLVGEAATAAPIASIVQDAPEQPPQQSPRGSGSARRL